MAPHVDFTATNLCSCHNLFSLGCRSHLVKGLHAQDIFFYFLHTFEGYFFKSSFCISFEKAIFSEKHQWVHLSQNLVHRTTQRRHFFSLKHQYIFRGQCLNLKFISAVSALKQAQYFNNHYKLDICVKYENIKALPIMLQDGFNLYKIPSYGCTTL